jgi:hypothetical protein
MLGIPHQARNEDGVFLFKPCAFAIVETESLPRSAWAVRLYPTQQQIPTRTPNNRRLSRDLEGNLRFTAVGGTTAHVPKPISKWNANLWRFSAITQIIIMYL